MTLIPLSHLRTDAADRGECSIRRDPRGIRTVCVLYPYYVCGFPPRSAAIREGSVLYAYCIRTMSVDFRRDPRGIRTVCVLYPYYVCGFPPRSVAIRSPILKVISCFTYAADAVDKVSPYWLRTLTVLHPSLSVLSPFFFSPLFVFFFVLHVLLCGA